MKIKLDEQNYVESFATVGDVVGSIEYTGEIPDDFVLKCKYYKLESNVLRFDSPKEQLENLVEEKQLRILYLKEQLAQTDYQAIKFSEGIITYDEYTPTRTQRQSWRTEINELEAQIASLEV